MILNRLFIWGLCMLMAGCTTMRQVNINENSTPQLKIKDHIVVYEKTGKIFDMIVVSFDGKIIKGSLVSNS